VYVQIQLILTACLLAAPSFAQELKFAELGDFRLVSGKVTYVHRWLWPAVLAVASARAPWQFARLSAPARDLYESVERQGTLLATGRPAKDLERRLLVHGEQIHTEAGHHEIRLESWSLWADRVSCHSTLSASEGRRQLESALRTLGGAEALLPWSKEESP